MDVETKLDLVRGIAEEIITEDDLKELFQTKSNPIAYDGFEPSGTANIAFGVYRPLLIKDLQKTGIKFKLWLADWFAWINNKMGGDLEAIQKVGEYFIETWKAAGVKNVEYIFAHSQMDQDYWKKVILIAKNTTVSRAIRCLTIMGRKEGEMKEVAQYFYPMMQCADIFQLKADITQLGLDQRKVNILAREVGPKLGWWKPVTVSHHMLMGLEGIKLAEGYETNEKMDSEIASKMSKSKPDTAVFMHDSKEEIARKIGKAFCEPKNTENNPVLEYAKELIFRAKKEFSVSRPKKFGGDVSFSSYAELEKYFAEGLLHPADLKNAVAEYIDKLVEPVRTHFEKNKKARELHEFVSAQEVTR
jgi:tyrosyl-tRNA synthetase